MESSLFVKHYLNPQMARAEFERTLKVYKQVAKINPSRLRIAQPVNVKDCAIYFEKITDCVNLRKLVCKVHVDVNILYYVGQSLAELHKALNPNIHSFDEKMYIHGDLWPTNVLYLPSKRIVYIVDFSPSRFDTSAMNYYDLIYRDLSHIIVALEIKYPLHKVYLLARKKNAVMKDKFLAGYESVMGLKIDKDTLLKYIVNDETLRSDVINKKNFIYRFVWTRLFKRAIRRLYKANIDDSAGQPVNKDYRESHIEPNKGIFYEDIVYAKDSAHSSLWILERQYLSDVVERLVARKNKYLDFACGTGRIVSDFANKFIKAQGVDISESMLSLARKKNLNTTFIKGDITKNPDIIDSNFDFVTAFRFFLNAQDSLCKEVMRILSEKLSPDGILVFNIHNSKPSFLALQNLITNTFRNRKIPSMSRREVADLVKQAGLETVETRAFGIIPKAAHGILGSKLWLSIDQTLSRFNILQKIGSDVLYVCRRKRTQ